VICDVIMQQFADFIHTAAKSELENFNIEKLKMIGGTPSFRTGWQSVIQNLVWLVLALVKSCDITLELNCLLNTN